MQGGPTRSLFVLALAAVALVETGVLVVQQRRVAQLESRLDDMETLAGLGLSAPAAYLLALDDAPSFTLSELTDKRRTSRAWVATFAEDQHLGPDEAMLLHALHDRFLTDYGEARVQQALGEYEERDAAMLQQILRKRYAAAAEHILGPDRVEAYHAAVIDRLVEWSPPVGQDGKEGSEAPKPPPADVKNTPYTQGAIAAERALLDAEGRVDEQLVAHLGRASAAEPTYTYLHYLFAWAAGRLEGPQATQRVLDDFAPGYEGWYRYYFDRPDAELLAYMRCHAVHACLQQSGQPIPGFLLRDDVPRPRGLVHCDDLQVDPATCPADYSLFERLTLRSRGSDRLTLWSPDDQPVDVDAFAASIGIAPGVRVADVGAGMGWFTMPFARIAGPTGSVQAIEIDPRALTLLEQVAHHNGLDNVHPVMGELDDITLPADSVDVVWMCDTLKTILRDDPRLVGLGPLLASIHRSLAAGGSFVVTEKVDKPGQPDAVSMERIQEVVQGAGFVAREPIRTFEPARAVLIFGKPR